MDPRDIINGNATKQNMQKSVASRFAAVGHFLPNNVSRLSAAKNSRLALFALRHPILINALAGTAIGTAVGRTLKHFLQNTHERKNRRASAHLGNMAKMYFIKNTIAKSLMGLYRQGTKLNFNNPKEIAAREVLRNRTAGQLAAHIRAKNAWSFQANNAVINAQKKKLIRHLIPFVLLNGAIVGTLAGKQIHDYLKSRAIKREGK